MEDESGALDSARGGITRGEIDPPPLEPEAARELEHSLAPPSQDGFHSPPSGLNRDQAPSVVALAVDDPALHAPPPSGGSRASELAVSESCPPRKGAAAPTRTRLAMHTD